MAEEQYKTKGVTFNLEDPDQKGLLDHALGPNGKRNFSAYVKRLIQLDKERANRREEVIKVSNQGGIKFNIG